MSANNDQMPLALIAGMHGFIAKPVTTSALENLTFK
jgi:hypothetical protein